MLIKVSELWDGISEIETEIIEYKENNQKLFLTSSLQSHSIPLLHIIQSIDKDIPVYFLDTGYHFTETIEFKESLKQSFGFNIQELRSPVERINQRDENGMLMYTSDPRLLLLYEQGSATRTYLKGIRRLD
jgi:phosphoadenosine phosphosulfate reductase